MAERVGDATQRQVWEAGVRLFAAQGFHGTGIRELADAAGLSSATLYHYMGTKQDLLFSIMKTCLDRLVAAAERVVANTTGPQAIIASLVHVHVLTHALYRDETSVVDNELGVLDAERRDAIVGIRDRYEGFWRSAIADGCERAVFSVPDQRLARLALLEMCSGVAKWYSPAGEVDLDAIATAHAQLALQLLGVSSKQLAATALPEAANIHGLVEDIWQIQLPSMRARAART